jgi:hypothetical protein
MELCILVNEKEKKLLGLKLGKVVEILEAIKES